MTLTDVLELPPHLVLQHAALPGVTASCGRPPGRAPHDLDVYLVGIAAVQVVVGEAIHVRWCDGTHPNCRYPSGFHPTPDGLLAVGNPTERTTTP